MKFKIFIGVSALAVALMAGCGDSTTNPESARSCLGLEIFELDACGLLITMAVDPTCNEAGIDTEDSLTVRYDFDNDGQWEGGFGSLASRPVFEPIELPHDQWLVSYEIRHADGRVDSTVASLDLPDWVPVPPDIIAAHIGHSDATVDTLRIGQSWSFMARAVHWMNTHPGEAIVRYYIDGEVFDEKYVGFVHPLEPGCNFSGKSHPGFDEVGTHELKVVWDVENIFAETDESNNELVKTLVVVAD